MMLQTVALQEPMAAGSVPDRGAAGGHPQGRRGAWQTAGEKRWQHESKRLAACVRLVAHLGMAACVLACVSLVASLIVAHIKAEQQA